ncbi:TMEM175 family protein [Microbacterium hydrocarbonoxydans]|uniref:TMEM175 family protein n=1 Tax=Microbacterium hydrocarbonoxydans TaxID=273678 RepID=UPI002041A220|nr:TMEM175 family protein [Microbacterium hydrocarbonoxydans]MCM3778092.1 TMEM175 family protein [Microbacterium hydrocarbonoxydans]
MSSEPAVVRLNPERFTAFVDAVVAIAMTLLILPLMESVSDAASGKLTTADFFHEHHGQLASFALSFLLIASFWTEHHRVYSRVLRITTPLIWINIVWLFTIVWLPVATAMIGQMPADALQRVVYIGTLIATQLTTLAAKWYFLRHPHLSDFSSTWLQSGVAGDAASATLFLIALAISILFPGIGYVALFLLLLTSPLARLLHRAFARKS